MLSGLVLCVFSGLVISSLRDGAPAPTALEPNLVDAISGEEVEHQPIPGAFEVTGAEVLHPGAPSAIADSADEPR